jgi:hypothetical protein
MLYDESSLYRNIARPLVVQPERGGGAAKRNSARAAGASSVATEQGRVALPLDRRLVWRET